MPCIYFFHAQVKIGLFDTVKMLHLNTGMFILLFLLPILICQISYSICLESVSFVLPLNTQGRLLERQLVGLILYDTGMFILVLLLLLVNHHMSSNILYALCLFLSCLIDKGHTVQAIGDARGREEMYCQLLVQRILNYKIRDLGGGDAGNCR